MAATTSTTLSEFIQTVVGRAVDDEIANHLFWPGAIASRWIQVRDLTTTPGLVASFPKYNALTAYDLTEGTDYSTTQALDPTATTITITEHGVQGVLTELAEKNLQSPNAQAQYVSDLVRNHVRSIMTKYDVDILTLFDSLDDGVENTGTNLTNAHVLECVNKCALANLPKPWAGFLHPQQYADLVNEAGSPFADTAASGAKAAEFYDSYYIARIYDVNWFMTTNAVAINAAADRSGAILSPNAIGAAWGMMPDTRFENDQSLRGREVLTVAHYGVGEIDGTMGMYLNSDA